MKLIYEIGIGESREKCIKMTDVQDVICEMYEETMIDGETVRGIGPKGHKKMKECAKARVNLILNQFKESKIPVAYIDVRLTSDGVEVYCYDKERVC